MSRRSATFVVGAGVVLTAMVGVVAPGASAGARSASRVGPDQTFVGVVNGRIANAAVVLACPEAVRPGETGHPAGGQTIAVRSPAPSTSSGDTGSEADAIVARFVTGTKAASLTVTFTRYGSQPIPTTVLLPCIGSGTIVFSAVPTSRTARSESMTVSFVSPCVGVCAGRRRDR